MDLFDRIAAYKNIIKIKKFAQQQPLNLNSLKEPNPSLSPQMENFNLPAQIEKAFSINLETRDPSALKNQLLNIGRLVGEAFLQATHKYDQDKNIPDKKIALEQEFRLAYQKIQQFMKHPLLAQPDHLRFLSEGSKFGSGGKFDYFVPFSQPAVNSRPPAHNQTTPPQNQMDMGLALGDIRQAQKNANEYMSYILRNTGAAQDFYVSRFISYVINPMVSLYEKAGSQKQITKPIESLFGTILQKLNPDKNTTLLGEEATAKIQEIGSKSFVET